MSFSIEQRIVVQEMTVTTSSLFGVGAQSMTERSRFISRNTTTGVPDISSFCALYSVLFRFCRAFIFAQVLIN